MYTDIYVREHLISPGPLRPLPSRLGPRNLRLITPSVPTVIRAIARQNSRTRYAIDRVAFSTDSRPKTDETREWRWRENSLKVKLDSSLTRGERSFFFWLWYSNTLNDWMSVLHVSFRELTFEWWGCYGLCLTKTNRACPLLFYFVLMSISVFMGPCGLTFTWWGC